MSARAPEGDALRGDERAEHAWEAPRADEPDLAAGDELLEATLASLRRAWSALPVPASDAPPRDEADEASAAWLRAAWSALEAPHAEPSHALRARARRGRSTRRASLALAGGVSALAAASVLALVLALRERAREHAPRLVQERAAPHGPLSSEQAGTIQVAAIDEGRMELRSGPVRLILLDEWTETPAERADAR